MYYTLYALTENRNAVIILQILTHIHYSYTVQQ